MVRARKRLGQHFLHHRRILERIAEALAAPAGARVLEIGSGQGGLTRVLAERGARVTAIEKDPGLAAMVEETLPGVLVVRGDALELEWRSVAGAAPGEPLFVAGNIPYNITSPLL
ncbi:MAG TPA: rRNA adenine N-6-methyltransferase family protein, partial [Gemmatimonadales bacterium]|nr:rRNA adenine N-6-methyltransferase family protein [Gemmatimonadales bacterium]